jgi:hypothetical protein
MVVLLMSTGIVINFPFVLRPARRTKWLAETKAAGRTPSRRSTKNNSYNPYRDDPFIWSFAMSHSLRDGKTRGLLDGLTDWAIGDLSRRLLKANSRWYMHPLHVPVVLLSVFFDHAAWEVNRCLLEAERFEFLSRDAGIGSLQRFDTITTELQYIRRNMDFLQSLTKFMLETLDFLEKKIFEREGDGPRDRYVEDDYRRYVYETNPHMEEKLNNTLHLIENNLATVGYMQARTRDALDFVSPRPPAPPLQPKPPTLFLSPTHPFTQIKGKIALRDNDSNREDADSNKTMSFLQMVFLPATFVAAIVSMNFFDLTTSPPKVSSYIWIFWLVAITLTGVVLAVYFYWKWRVKMKIKEEERELRRKERMVDWEGATAVEQSGGYDSSGGDGGGKRRRKKKRRRRSGNYDSEEDGGKRRKEKPELGL